MLYSPKGPFISTTDVGASILRLRPLSCGSSIKLSVTSGGTAIGVRPIRDRAGRDVLNWRWDSVGARKVGTLCVRLACCSRLRKLGRRPVQAIVRGVELQVVEVGGGRGLGC
jgi:hypothetical protein